MALKPCKECGKEISTEARTCPHCGKANPTGKRQSPLAIGCLGLVALGVLGSLMSRGNTGTTSNSASAPAESRHDQALRQIKLDFSWSKGGFDNVMIATFTVKNPSPISVKDLEISCDHFAESGTKIDNNTKTIYQQFPANSTHKVRDFNMGFIHSQAHSTSCSVTDLVAE